MQDREEMVAFGVWRRKQLAAAGNYLLTRDENDGNGQNRITIRKTKIVRSEFFCIYEINKIRYGEKYL